MAHQRPTVTLTFAQSLDGSITRQRGQPLALSGVESMTMTHRLRAEHDAILVGIGTVLADNPSLTVRLVEGSHPQPIVADSHLRCPLDATVVKNGGWIATVAPVVAEKKAALEAAGATVIVLPADEHKRVSLPALLDWLGTQSQVSSLMVEGGARIIQSLLQAKLATRVIVTIAPMLVGGLKALDALPHNLTLSDVRYEQIGKDLVVSGWL